MRLSREIRFALVPPDQLMEGRPGNSWAGWPSTNLVVPQLVLRCVIDGQVDPATGYLCDIKVVDQLLRSIVTGHLIQGDPEPQSAESILQTVYRELRARWQQDSSISSVTLALSPFLSYSIVAENNMNQKSDQLSSVRLTQQFEFSAAHRLHCNQLSSDENKRLFGKCNNRAGHGHNYVLEVTVSNQLDSDRGHVIELEKFESTVKRLVVDRLDHKHLNEDIDYFANVNPTVENIAVAIFEWLIGQFGDVKLEKVKVYETPKTWAEYADDTKLQSN
jgi:6-pyruvoyltetrahydropterin/6-carboxytetrahydropterin synthase